MKNYEILDRINISWMFFDHKLKIIFIYLNTLNYYLSE